jgi:hypothetical protein
VPRPERAIFAVCWVIALVLIVRWTNSGGGSEAAVALMAHGGLGLTALTSRARQRTITYACPQRKGRVTFAYSCNNGRYSLGTGDNRFETAWSRSDGDSINIYNDPSSMDGVAVIEGARSFFEVGDATTLDMSGRMRTACENEIVVLKNRSGYYATIRVVDVKNAARDDVRDEITFDYLILPRGATDFSVLA